MLEIESVFETFIIDGETLTYKPNKDFYAFAELYRPHERENGFVKIKLPTKIIIIPKKQKGIYEVYVKKNNYSSIRKVK